ncbi:sigma-70 family RNA polymerase sigma factor [Verrucomicrobiaceae bacterium 5K15]|uniref:Sigma-70 family RNA polymerase sigma factor n=1 Tax=Oceaniferula flava TaxID=2800421 RepID=A0AAE2SDE0_9BACT|nr:sigma-70 family RNA polymerase sigma factor [Oceaniferula flavus]MBK1854256.1 sigma-70 family RNA polymerase sigma factor [Oceaniferula flavus]MBM1135562.1 sigma-70 family RNA polymerase sigma factor [Oceaniferula flavus]
MGDPNDKDMVETSSELVERAISEFESPLIGYAKTIVHDLDRARDVVQDTFIRLYQQDAGKVNDGLKSWLFTVCRNRALDVLRKEKRMVPTDEDLLAAQDSGTDSPATITVAQERVEQVKACISKLPENQATVILLKFEKGYSYQEISDQTGLSTGNVGFLIHTGMKRLRSILPDDLK